MPEPNPILAAVILILVLYAGYRLVRGTGEPWRPPEDDDEIF